MARCSPNIGLWQQYMFMIVVIIPFLHRYHLPESVDSWKLAVVDLFPHRSLLSSFYLLLLLPTCLWRRMQMVVLVVLTDTVLPLVSSVLPILRCLQHVPDLQLYVDHLEPVRH